MFLNRGILVLVLIGSSYGKIYFEENFDDDSWRERWITSVHNGTQYGKFETTAGEYFGNPNNTGLGTTEKNKWYALSTHLTPFATANNTLVLQFSVKYEEDTVCEVGYIQLYDCEFEPTQMHIGAPFFLRFGLWTCEEEFVDLRVNYFQNQSINSKINRESDEFTHIYTLILQPDLSYRILIDNKSVPKKNIIQIAKQMHGSRYDIRFYPDICGIGFNLYQYSSVAIFDNVLLTDDVDVAKRKRKTIMDEMKEEAKMKNLQDEVRREYLRSGRLVEIASEDLTRVLNCNRSINLVEDNTTTPLLVDFSRFLVPFNWSNNNNIIMETAEYNQHICNSRTTIQLWISFQPRDDISLDIESVLEIVNKANSIVASTVTTIVIDYGYLLLDHETLPFVNHEIRKARKKLTSSSVKAPKLAVQISDVNCRSKHEFIKHLELTLLDYLVISPKINENEFAAKSDLDRRMFMLPCIPIIEFLNNTGSLALHVNSSVEIDFDKGTYKCYEDRANDIAQYYEDTILVLHAVNKMRSKDTVNTKQTPMLKGSVNWLYQTSGFSMSHFGAVISWKEIKVMGLEIFASTILKTFQNIIIDFSSHKSENDYNDLLIIVQEIAGYSLLAKKQNSRENYSFRLSDDNTQLQTSILIPIGTNDFQINKRQVDKIVSTAMKANNIFSGTVNTIIFDWMACSRSDNCRGYKEVASEGSCWQTRRLENFANIIKHANESINMVSGNNYVGLGPVADKQLFGEAFLEAAKESCTDDLFNALEVFDHHGICKTIVHNDDIVKYGGIRVSNMAIDDFSLCLMGEKVDSGKSSISYFVNVIGCDDDHSNMTPLLEYAKLMENLNKWAVDEDILLFINAGTEVHANCVKSLPPADGGCECGWWVKKEPDGTYQDKKSLARQLYENEHKSPTNGDNGKSTSTVPMETLLWILTPSIIFALVLTFFTAFFILHYRSKYMLTKQEVDEFIKGRQVTRVEDPAEGDEAAVAQSYSSKKYELSPSTFTTDIISGCLGSGEFGRVYRGSIRRDGVVIETAVKMLNNRIIGKSHGYYVALKGLLSEIKILAYVGEHNHIVTLLGAYTKKLRKGEIAVFLELCQLGSLDKYLRSLKPQILGTNDPTHNAGLLTEETDSITDDDEESRIKPQFLDNETSDLLYMWAGEIASGMEFLASKKLVHADLATRNILLTGDKTAKICDFGLSRRLYDYTEYVKQNQSPLPWRWMAPESLCRLFFNEKTDIWAFGVTLWEMFTLGDQPYPGLTWNGNFPSLLERGLRLPEPRYNVKEIYTIMQRCWNISPHLRPTFSQLKAELNFI